MILEKNKTDFASRIRDLLPGKSRIWVLLAFAFIFQLIHVLMRPFPKPDALTYLHIVRDWSSGASLENILAEFPKFGLLIFSFLPVKWLYQAGIPLYYSAVSCMMLMSIVSVWAFYRIVLIATGDSVKAMWAGALLAVHPPLLIYAGNLLRDTPYLMFCLLHVLCFMESVCRRKWYFFLLAGATLAMSVLSRFEAWEMLCLFPVLALFYMFCRHFSGKEKAQFILCSAAGFSGTILLMLALTGSCELWLGKMTSLFFFYLPDWVKN